MSSTPRKILIGLPAYRFTSYTGLTISLAAAMGQLHRYPLLSVCDFKAIGHVLIDECRNMLVQEALTHEADWLLMLDDDASFEAIAPWELIMMAEAFGATVAGLPYPIRGTGEPCVEQLPEVRKGFKPCERIGAGVMAIDLAKLGRWRPWFISTPQPQGGSYSEDYYFCDQVREKGGSVFCDWRHPAGNGNVRAWAPTESPDGEKPPGENT